MRKIMVIDDNADFLALMQAWLESEGFEVCLCQDSRAAVDTVCAGEPDLIILDLLMPNKSGISVLSELKLLNSTLRIPVIVLSAASRQSQSDELLVKRLSEDSVSKPFDFDYLLSRVNRCLGAAGGTSEFAS